MLPPRSPHDRSVFGAYGVPGPKITAVVTKAQRKWTVRNITIFGDRITPKHVRRALAVTSAKVLTDAKSLARQRTGLAATGAMAASIKREEFRRSARATREWFGYSVYLKAADMGLTARRWYPQWKELGGKTSGQKPLKFLRDALWRNRRLFQTFMSFELQASLREVNQLSRQRQSATPARR